MQKHKNVLKNDEKQNLLKKHRQKKQVIRANFRRAVIIVEVDTEAKDIFLEKKNKILTQSNNSFAIKNVITYLP